LVEQGGAFSSVDGGRRPTGPWFRPARSQAPDAQRAKGTRGEGGAVAGFKHGGEQTPLSAASQPLPVGDQERDGWEA